MFLCDPIIENKNISNAVFASTPNTKKVAAKKKKNK